MRGVPSFEIHLLRRLTFSSECVLPGPLPGTAKSGLGSGRELIPIRSWEQIAILMVERFS
jgi:hypothetical protein